VRDAAKLRPGTPVFYQGVDIGEVTQVRGPTRDLPGYKLRMAVDKLAFKHIPMDAPVRVDQMPGDGPWYVVILPGREKADWFYPGQVKALREITPSEEAIRMTRDVLDGLVNLSKSKATEAQLLELKEKVKSLENELTAKKKENEELKNQNRTIRQGTPSSTPKLPAGPSAGKK